MRRAARNHNGTPHSMAHGCTHCIANTSSALTVDNSANAGSTIADSSANAYAHSSGLPNPVTASPGTDNFGTDGVACSSASAAVFQRGAGRASRPCETVS